MKSFYTCIDSKVKFSYMHENKIRKELASCTCFFIFCSNNLKKWIQKNETKEEDEDGTCLNLIDNSEKLGNVTMEIDSNDSDLLYFLFSCFLRFSILFFPFFFLHFLFSLLLLLFFVLPWG